MRPFSRPYDRGDLVTLPPPLVACGAAGAGEGGDEHHRMRRRCLAGAAAALFAVVTAGCTGPLFEAELVEVVASDCIAIRDDFDFDDDVRIVALGGGMVGDPEAGVVTGRSWTRMFPWVDGPVVAAEGEIISAGGGGVLAERAAGYPCGADQADSRLRGFCAVGREC